MSRFHAFLLFLAFMAGIMLTGCSPFVAVPLSTPTSSPVPTIVPSTPTKIPTATKAPSATAKATETSIPMVLPQPTETPASLDGKTLLELRCNACHPASYVAQLRGTADQWAGLVDMMVQNGADLTPQEEKVLSSYLAQKYH